MVARLFPETLRIRELTVNKLSLPEKWNGGLAITGRAELFTPEVADKHLLTLCGGMAANTIHTYGNAYVEQNMSRFPHHKKLMDATGATDDYEMIKDIAQNLADSNRLDRARIIWNAIQTVLGYLMQPDVREAVTQIAIAVTEHRNLRMSRWQIEWLLWRKIGWSKLRAVKKTFLKERYPLNKRKITRLL
jgi:hypothetical protein